MHHLARQEIQVSPASMGSPVHLALLVSKASLACVVKRESRGSQVRMAWMV
jgi:hypothetical protein